MKTQGWTAIRVMEPVDLKIGDRNDRVLHLQTVLKLLGCYDGAIDGDFGSKTQTAVNTVQKFFGLSVNGTFDLQTWYALNFWLPSSLQHSIASKDQDCFESSPISQKCA